MTYPVFVAIGAVLMLFPMLYVGHLRKLPVTTILICCVWFTVGGILGVRLMHLLEAGRWDGRSFFGALFIAPPFAYIIAKILRKPFATISDLCPAAISAILALLKYKCYLDGCCYGKVISTDELGRAIRFPSQLVELAAAIVLLVIFLILARKGWMQGCLYGLYMLTYGIVRFYLNTWRETTPFVFRMAAGNFWSLVSVFLGLVWIVIWIIRKKATRVDHGTEFVSQH